MGFFQTNDHKYAINISYDKQSFSNGRWQEMWGGLFLKFSFQVFFGWIIQTKNNEI
jgi:hypothetical protein